MIALRDETPLLSFAAGIVAPFDPHWLLVSLEAAACDAERKVSLPEESLQDHLKSTIQEQAKEEIKGSLEQGEEVKAISEELLNECIKEQVPASMIEDELEFSLFYPAWPPALHLVKSMRLYLQKEFPASVMPLEELEILLKEVLRALEYPEVASNLALRPPPVAISLLEVAREAGEGYELSFFQLLRQRIAPLRQARVTRIDFYDLKPTLRYLKSRLRLHHYQHIKKEIVAFLQFYSLGSSSLKQGNLKKAFDKFSSNSSPQAAPVGNARDLSPKKLKETSQKGIPFPHFCEASPVRASQASHHLCSQKKKEASTLFPSPLILNIQ